MNNYSNDTKNRSAVSAINSEGEQISAVFIAGDLTYSHLESQFVDTKSIFDELTCDWYAVPGNHDEYGDGLTYYDNYIGDRHFVCDIADKLRVIGFRSAPADSILELSGRVYADELAWLETQLQNANGKSIILITHYHTINRRTRHIILGDYGGNEIINLIDAYNVSAIFCGHNHQDCDLMHDDNGNVVFSLPSIQNTRLTTDGGWIICNLFDNRIEIDYRNAATSEQFDFPFYKKQVIYL